LYHNCESTSSRNPPQLITRPPGQNNEPPNAANTPTSAPPTTTTQKQPGKPTKKRSVPAPTHSITSIPIDSENKTDSKKQFKCVDCGKCVSSARNLTRHRSCCKAVKPKPGEESATTPTHSKSSSSSGSPPKQQKPNAPQQKQPVDQPPIHFQPYIPENLPPNATVIYAPPPPNHQPYTPHYPAPHTALPHSNSSQNVFEYPTLHSAPPTMSNYPPPNYGPPPGHVYERPPVEYNGVGEPPNSSVYAFPTGMDSFIENAIDEVAHNPLSYIIPE
jgi:hypothetical protein